MSLLMTANKIISLVFITKHIYIGKGLICYMLHYYDKKKSSIKIQYCQPQIYLFFCVVPSHGNFMLFFEVNNMVSQVNMVVNQYHDINQSTIYLSWYRHSIICKGGNVKLHICHFILVCQISECICHEMYLLKVLFLIFIFILLKYLLLF